MIARAHELGLRVLVDIVPNHSSSEHPWFQEALAAEPGSAARARYVFRDGTGEHGEEPPNNWLSVFGGPGWTRVTEADGSPGQWYLHLFDVTQPDFDWTNPEVGDEMESVLRFWLDRGVDGFRIDVANGLVKAEGLPDAGSTHGGGASATDDDADVGPAGRARHLPPLAQGHRLLRRRRRGRRPDPLRRGVGAAGRVAGEVRAQRRAAPVASTSGS